ncbi:Cof-type HAD-IIB family hydrolase [Ruminococcaceae bacterium OttesenSCG-928-L11]|nr:Cof-type HAD-IIB family hydrolase [Ruminococcaceae bacterium OttesenSCG-928-L11]
MIKLIVTDLDNTLLDSQKTISPFTIDILRQCQKKGLMIAFATARPERATKKYQRDFTPDFIIANNGASIEKNGEVIFNNPISRNILLRLIPELLSHQEITCITVEAGDCLYTTYDGPPWEEGWNPIYCDFEAIPDKEITKISTECENIATIQQILRNYPILHLYDNSGERWQQIMLASSTKFNAISQIADAYQLGISSIVAFGDDSNDIDMIRNCGVGIAVSNAIDSAKNIADEICGSNSDDGVAKWLAINLL